MNPVPTTKRRMPVFINPNTFSSRIPAGMCKPCNKKTPVRQMKATRRTGENMARDGEGADPKDARVYSANTRVFAAPCARPTGKKGGWSRKVRHTEQHCVRGVYGCDELLGSAEEMFKVIFLPAVVR
jgi:hypothetical protein